jgi:hypothetical protein
MILLLEDPETGSPWGSVRFTQKVGPEFDPFRVTAKGPHRLTLEFKARKRPALTLGDDIQESYSHLLDPSQQKVHFDSEAEAGRSIPAVRVTPPPAPVPQTLPNRASSKRTTETISLSQLQPH